MTRIMEELGYCQVRSGTRYPCSRPAAVKIMDIPFCKRCAHEQEAYFAIGELTEIQNNKLLIETLNKLRRTEGQHYTVAKYEPEVTREAHLTL